MKNQKTHTYKNQKMTNRELSELKGVSVSHMRNLIRDHGVDGAMDYTKSERRAPMKIYQYKGQSLDVNQLIYLAVVKCTAGSMHLRIKKHGVNFAVENDDFEKFKRSGYQNRKPKELPDLPEYDPDKHLLNNMIASLSAQGMPICKIRQEIKRRLAA